MNTGDADNKPKAQLLSGVSSTQIWPHEGGKQVCKRSFVPHTGQISVLSNLSEKQTSKKTELTGKGPALLSPARLAPILRGL